MQMDSFPIDCNRNYGIIAPKKMVSGSYPEAKVVQLTNDLVELGIHAHMMPTMACHSRFVTTSSSLYEYKH